MTKGFVTGVAALGIALVAGQARGGDINFDARWGAWAEFGGFYGTDESSYGELIVFAPLAQTRDSLVFTEIRGEYFEHDVLEANAAIGYRRMLGSGWNLGAWAGLDVRYTENDNTFGQVSGGLEALSESFDLRVNGYLPFTGPQAADGTAEVVLEGSNIFMIGGEEIALYGVDGEVGGRLPLGEGNAAILGGYVGGFFFDHEDAIEAITGGKARVELAFNDVVGDGSRLSAQYEFTHDNVRGDRHLIGARLRIPFGGAPAASEVSPQWLRMTDRLERDTNVVIGKSGEEEPVEDALTDVDFDQVVYTADNGDSVTDASNAGGANTLIIVNGTIAGAQQLQGDQTLQGGGSTILVRGRNSGAVASFTAPGPAATLDTPGSASNLTLLGSNTHVAGLTIVGDRDDGSNRGIFVGTGLDNIVIEQTSISDIGHVGILFGDNHGDVTIADTSVTNAGSDGFRFGDGNDNITITNATASQTGDGISFRDGNSNVTISGLTVTDVRGSGVSFRNGNTNVTISGATITDTEFAGIHFVNNNSGVTITGSTLTDADIDGINVGIGNSDVTISDTTISDTISGIRINTGSDVTISGVTIADGFDGVTIGSDATVTMNDSRFEGAFGGNGIDILGSGNTLNGAGNTSTATFGGNLCEDSGVAWTGAIVIDGATITSANCP